MNTDKLDFIQNILIVVFGIVYRSSEKNNDS